MSIKRNSRVGTRLGVVCLAVTAGASIAPRAEAAGDSINGVTITSINLYYGALNPASTGALIFFSPAKPEMGGCSNAPGNAVWVEWSSSVQPDGKALYASLYASYVAGMSVGLSTSGCTSDGYYPVVRGITL